MNRSALRARAREASCLARGSRASWLPVQAASTAMFQPISRMRRARSRTSRKPSRRPSCRAASRSRNGRPSMKTASSARLARARLMSASSTLLSREG
ncbi:hypothetical protein D3C78_1682970 [compost metagenome]